MRGSFAQEFINRANEDVIPLTRERKAESQANVVGAAVETMTLDTASILVFMDETFTAVGQQPVYNGACLRMVL